MVEFMPKEYENIIHFAYCNRRNTNTQSCKISDSYLKTYFEHRKRDLNETEN